MNISQTTYKQAIQEIANSINKGQGYEYILQQGNLPQITKQIIYDSFVKNKDLSGPEFLIIQEYAKELDELGYVNFK